MHQKPLGEELLTKADLAQFATKPDLAELRADIYRALWIQGISLAVATTILMWIIVAIAEALL